MKRNNRNKFIQTILTIILCLLFYAFSALAQESPKPNFIVILADDMGWADLGADGSRIETPNLDRMAQEGLKFSHFYAMGPMCSPTRAALLSGRYQHTVGVPELCYPDVRNGLPRLHLDLNAITIPEALKTQGYQSMLAGKWHLGHEPQYWPRKHGFDRFWGSLLGTPRYWNPKETYDNETPIEVGGYFTDKITDSAVSFIRENKEKPFFLYLAYNAPHYPLEAPSELINKYKKRFDYDNFAIYAAMVERMDTGIGRVFATLRELGLDKNTFIFFTSDNGPSAESKRGEGYGLRGAKISAGLLREHKFSTFEGGIREPAIAWWPGHITQGSSTDRVACIMDIFPTYMDILDADPATELHGTSMMPLLLGKGQDIHEDLHWETRLMWAVQKGKWKLVGRFWETQPHLYNLKEDIGEQNDLASQFPGIVEELALLHRQWQIKHYPDYYPRQTNGRPSYHFPQE